MKNKTKFIHSIIVFILVTLHFVSDFDGVIVGVNVLSIKTAQYEVPLKVFLLLVIGPSLPVLHECNTQSCTILDPTDPRVGPGRVGSRLSRNSNLEI